MVETDISDPHALIFSFLKTTYTKTPPDKLLYRNYKQFETNIFLQDVEKLTEKISNKE